MKSWKKMVFIGSTIAIVLVGCGSANVSENNTVETVEGKEANETEEAVTTTGSTTEKDFRVANWKDTMEDVLKNETAVRKPNEFAKNDLYFKGTLCGYDVEIDYTFDSDGLLKEGEYYTLKYFDDKGVEECFNAFKNGLTEKYGDPISEEVSSGCPTVIWETPTTTIRLTEVLEESLQSCFIFYSRKSDTTTDMF